MSTLNKAKLVIAALSAAMLMACGGGSSSGTPPVVGASSALFQALQANTYSGYTDVGSNINDSSSNSSSGCGIYSPVSDQAAVEAKITSLGGTVGASTPTKWCGTASGVTSCLLQFDKFFVSDVRAAQVNMLQIDMPGLVSDSRTVVKYISQDSSASIRTETRDSTRMNSSNCPVMATQTANAIDGSWLGYKATYNTSNWTGTSTSVNISCVNQVCTLSDAPTTTITLRQVNNGTWSTIANAQKYAGASVSDDRQLLSLFVCSAPLIEAQTFASCSFYTFKR